MLKLFSRVTVNPAQAQMTVKIEAPVLTGRFLLLTHNACRRFFRKHAQGSGIEMVARRLTENDSAV